MLIYYDNIGVITRRVHKNLVFPTRVMDDKQLFIILVAQAFVKVFIQVKTEKLPLFITVKIHLTVYGMNRRSITLSVSGQDLHILPILITRQPVRSPIVFTSAILCYNHVLAVNCEVNTTGPVKIRTFFRNRTIFKINEVKTVIKIKC